MRISPKTLAFLLLGTLLACPTLSAAEPVAEQETPAQRDVRMKWWREARFGMFIHWGVYSVPAGKYNGKDINGIGEWIMNQGRIPCAEYQQYAQKFNPVKYDADQWVALAKEAGMKYIVITSKHHDGFAMFDSKASDWNIVKATPFKRDPLKELAAACKKHDIKLGFYYSQAQDWNNPGGAAAGGQWDKAQEGSMDDYVDKVAVPQLREILSNYGPISVLWWDTPCDMNKERAMKCLEPLKLQPGLVMNDRLGGDFDGDTSTPEQTIPAMGYPNRDWETCMTMNDTWGYKSEDHNWKSTAILIRNLIDIASKGGNYLLNVGPTSEGLIPDPSIERLKEVGKWMKVNGDSIYGTTAGPFKKLPWGRATKKVHDKGATLYLNVFEWPTDGKLVVPGLKNAAEKAYLLSDTAKKPLKVENTADGVVISVPKNAPDKISSVVVLEAKGALDVEMQLISPNADGSITLDAADVVCQGNEVKAQEVDSVCNIGYWTNPEDTVKWDFKVTKPGTYEVTAELSALEGAKLEIVLGSEKLQSASPVTGDYNKYQTQSLGKIKISATGKTTLTLKPVAEGWHPMNVRNLTLKPVK